ncbi:MAG TPA: methyltransferase domain-containing protein [Gemmatimonadaceae bacterium]|nr:methyltransferase domain-containing protein [Gemmatimonadaceae bacterium]
MKSISGVGLRDVTSAYSSPEGDLWELLMGQQIHIGGMKASIDLAERAGVGAGMNGVDLCCCNGAGMRVLVRFRHVASMVGVDATQHVVERGMQRCGEEGLENRIRFVVADACQSGLPSASADFVWGEDAWCYVTDKRKLVAEAARLVRPGGVIAFTDWVDGRVGLTDEEAQRFLRMMRFANVENIDGYARLLAENGCEVLVAEDTGRFPSHVDLLLNMIEMQLTYDVLRTIGFNRDLLRVTIDGFRFLGELSRADKIAQARFVARRR